MNKHTVGFVIVAILAVAVAIFLVNGRPDKHASGQSSQAQTSKVALPTAATSNASAPQPPASPDDPGPTVLAGQAESLKHATDYLEYAKNTIDAARRSDHEAQYYLSQALHYCDSGYRMYFDRYGKRRTLDEALQWASTRSTMSANEAKQVYERCHRLMDEGHRADFGKSADWVEQSSNGGFPLGKVAMARSLLVEAGSNGVDTEASRRNDAKKLAIEALHSKNPDVVWQMGDVAPSFVGDVERANKEQWAWRIAACERGYDCGKGADWLAFACRFDPNCQPYETGVDVMRRMIGPDFDEIEQRAKELNARLDADQFDDLGF